MYRLPRQMILGLPQAQERGTGPPAGSRRGARGGTVVAHVTAIVSDAQVEYRVGQAHGCGPDPAVDYRVQGMGGAHLWLG